MSVALPDYLDLIATAPGGIQKLRGLILELAVRGKLVPQNPDDEPASELLKRIAHERARLEAEGICKKSKPLSPVGDDEQPFALPLNWAWVRLPEVYFSISPSGNKLLSSAIQETGAVPVVDQGKRYIAGYTDQVSMLINIPGPVVIFGDHTTERKYVDFDFVAGADGVKILRPILQYERFFFRQLQGFKLEERGYARHFKVLNDQLYALPPLAEQHRIVAKVDELMALCDQLEAEQADAASAHARLVETLLGTLTQSTDAADLAANWQRLAGHFDTLFTTEASIDALKQTVLQLAVMGKLVVQDPNDEPASELLKQIAQEQARLVAGGHQKKLKSLSPVDEANVPFALPNGWAWARFPEVGQFGRGKSKHRPRNDPALFNPGIYPLVQTGEVARAGTIVHEIHSKYSDVGLNQSKMWPKGTLCITIAANIADSAILGFDACFPDSVVGFVPSELIEDSYYFLWFMKTAREELLKFAPSTAQKNINLEILESVRIPLPPLAEMQRIVAKVDELMALCDRLKGDLSIARLREATLADTLIESALEAA